MLNDNLYYLRLMLRDEEETRKISTKRDEILPINDKSDAVRSTQENRRVSVRRWS